MTASVRIITLATVIVIAWTSIAWISTPPVLHRTVRVDKSNTFDTDSIQDAIDNFIGIDVTVQWTVLIYAGEYTEEIILDNQKENIDLVGVDPDAVIIKSPANKNAITIKGVGARNNTIQNLTIITNDSTADKGHGILIDKEGTGSSPSAISIIGVTIKTDGDDSNGIHFEKTATDIQIINTSMTTADGYGIDMSDGETVVPSNIDLNNVTITAGGTGYKAINGANASDVSLFNCVLESALDDAIDVGTDFSIDTCTIYAPTSTATALTMTSESGLEITNSFIGVANSAGNKPKRAILIDSSSDVEIVSSLIQSQEETIRLDQPGDDVRFRSCFISAEGEGSNVVGIYGEANDSSTETPPVFHCCDIEVKAGSLTEVARCVEIDKTEGIEFVHCYIRAFSRNEQADVLGIAALTAHVNIIQCAFNELAKRSTGNVNIARN